jgi:hypothetical protein
MKNPIARYLMCAYAYYEQDDPLISDVEFDMLAKYILQNYDDISHFHKHLVTKEDLEAGTYLGKYPERVKGAVRDWRTIRKKPQLKPMMPTEKVGLENFF